MSKFADLFHKYNPIGKDSDYSVATLISEGYKTLDLDFNDVSDAQRLVLNALINTGIFRERERILTEITSSSQKTWTKEELFDLIRDKYSRKSE